MGRVRIGCSGWNYADWRERVYPRGVPVRRWLAHYATLFDTVEINSTFYRPGDPKAAAGWVGRVAHNPEFKFTAKLWRRFTHEREGALGHSSSVRNFPGMGERALSTDAWRRKDIFVETQVRCRSVSY